MILNRVEKGFYLDSVALMRISRTVCALPGVEMAALMIGSPSNKALMRDAQLLAAEGEQASANDLVIAVRANSQAAAITALDTAGKLLSEKEKPPQGDAGRARSLTGALERMPDANLALISVPGEFAALEARRALMHGLNALVFSDNVPLEDELALKTLARQRGLLMMGPDCGTALIAGTPIAFANAVPRGEIGIVSASGTGLQEVSSLIARLGGGVSHGIGVGGRDLDRRIGALGTLSAIEALDQDAGTRAIVLISKPPAAEVAKRVLDRVAQSAKTFVVCFLGLRELALPKNARLARTLTEAAELLCGKELNVAQDKTLHPPRPKGRWLRGLYCGGTLCAEAEIIFRDKGLPTGAQAHRFIDLGDDEYTRGRPHPMIEPELRNDHVHQALADAEVGAVLVDLVLGFGSHPDPAGVLCRMTLSAKPVIASVTGTDADPQGYARQTATLREAGVLVASSNAHAAQIAASLDWA
jgi:FdrA protein